MGEASLSNARVFREIPAPCLEAYRNLLKFYLRRCVGLARAHGASSSQVTDAVLDRELITRAVARRLYQGEEGKGNEVLETAALRARITRAWGGGAALVQLWHEAVDAAAGEKEWLKRHPAALSKQQRDIAVAEKRLERARDLAQAAQYRRALRILMHSSPADLDDETVQTALRALHPERKPVSSLPPIALPSATIPSRKLLKNVLRRMDDHSAAGPDGMPVPHLKLLVRPRTGETTDDSGLAALHGFVCLMAEGELSAEAANFHAWATLLACTKPNGKYRSIAIGTTIRRLVSCCLMKLALPGTRDYFAPHQIANGVPAGTEVAIHALRETLGKYGWDPGRVAIFIDARNAFNEIDRQRILDEVIIHAPGIARYVHMVYGSAPWLIAGGRMIQSLQGTQQGDLLGMFLFSLVLQPLIDELQAKCALDLNIWCADDGTLVGRVPEIAKAVEILHSKGAGLGYHLEVDKSKLWWPTVDVNLLDDLPFEFLEDKDAPDLFRPAIGVKYLGAPVGNDAFVERHIRSRMTRIDELLTAVEELDDPHISTHMHRLCASVVQVVHIFRATPYEQTAPLLDEFDAQQKMWINRLLPTAADLEDDPLQQASLDRRDGGLGHLPAEAVTIPAYVGSKIDTAHAVAMLPGQPSVQEMTAPLSALLNKCYCDFDVAATESLLVPSLLRNPGHNQQKISRAVQERRSARFWPSPEVATKDLPFEDQVKRSRFKSITTREARAWQDILPGKHELTSETWTLWLQYWLGAAIYDQQLDGCKPRCKNCGQRMDRFGWHSLGNCKSGYGRTARHNSGAGALQREGIHSAGIPSRREELGLLPDADDRPGDVYVTTSAGCTDAAYSSAAFDFTVRGAIPDSGQSNALLIRSCSTPGAAACDGEEQKLAHFATREEEVALLLYTDKGIRWKRSFQFRPFGMDTFGAYGPEAKKAVDQFSKIRASRFNQSIASCRRKILQAVSIAHITTSAKMLSSRRPQPSSVVFNPALGAHGLDQH